MLLGASRGVYTAIERMGKSKGGKGGRIVNVASVAGLTVSTLKNASKDLLSMTMLYELQQFVANTSFIHDFCKNKSFNSIFLPISF